jgi:hypothetical protein
MRMGGQCHAPAALPPGKTQYPSYGRLGWPQGWSGWVQKISLPLGFDPQTIQPVASRYTDWAVGVHSVEYILNINYIRNLISMFYCTATLLTRNYITPHLIQNWGWKWLLQNQESTLATAEEPREWNIYTAKRIITMKFYEMECHHSRMHILLLETALDTWNNFYNEVMELCRECLPLSLLFHRAF